MATVMGSMAWRSPRSQLLQLPLLEARPACAHVLPFHYGAPALTASFLAGGDAVPGHARPEHPWSSLRRWSRRS
jgi:hypothetical protein